MFYTDGLVERPKIPLTKSINELLRVVRAASSAEEVCQLAVEQLVPVEGLRDDVAIVAVQNGEFRKICVCVCLPIPRCSHRSGASSVGGYAITVRATTS